MTTYFCFWDPHWVELYHMHAYHRTAPGMTLWLYPVLSYVSLKPGCRTYLTTHVKKEKKKKGEHIYTYFHLLFFVFKQVIAQKLNKVKLGSTLLGVFPSEVAISVASFFGDQGYLVSVWLTNLFHDWTFNFFLEKGGKSSNYPILKDLGFGG